jgi:biotin operon repressor
VNSSIEAHATAYGRIPLWWIVTLRKSGAGIMARDVLAVLASYAERKTGKAWPSQETICATLGVSSRAVKKAIAELAGCGIVRVTRRNRRKGESNVYRLLWHPPNQVNESFTYNEPGLGEQGVHVNDGDRNCPPHSVHPNGRNVLRD